MIAMVKKYSNLFSIIKTALIGSREYVTGGIDYSELFDISKKHQIVPLVFQGLYKIFGDFEEKDRYYKQTIRLMSFDNNQQRWLRKIQNVFLSNHIDYMLLKGASIKKIYSSSELRIMSDVDILIKEEQYPMIRELLLGIGLIEKQETDHELIWASESGIAIELHKKLIPSYNDDYYAYYSDSWGKATVKQGNHYAMSVEDEYIYIFTHLTKHYRDGGIGLRHMIDIWYFRYCHPEMDMSYVETELNKLKLTTFHKNIWETVQVWFAGKEATALTDHITERIIESGSYGIKDKCDAANAARLSAMVSSVSTAKAKHVAQLVFMPYSSMKKKYPFLRYVPFLLPVMWVVRWIQALLLKQNNISRQMDRVHKINKETVNAYNVELEMVGLKFDL